MAETSRAKLLTVPALVVLVAITALANDGASTGQAAPVQSPALRQLAEDARRDSSALNRFWTAVRTGGAPLVEPAPGATDRSLITFLYRSTADVRVQLVPPHLAATSSNGIGREFMALGAFARLADTDVHYLTFEVADTLRFSYRLQVNGRAALDPLNEHVFAAKSDFAESIVSLRHAPPQPWRENPAKGSWTEQHLNSRILGSPQSIWVYTPAAYDPAARDSYPALIGLGSVTYGVVLPTARVIEYLAAQQVIRPTLIVAGPDLAAIGDQGGYDRAVAFLADELLPWAKEHYRISSRPSDIVVSGASRGGLIAAYAALRRPDAFERVLSFSGAFYWRPPQTVEYAWLPALFAREPRQAIKLYLAAGALETVITSTNAGHYPLGTNRHMRDVLRAKGYEFEFAEYYGGHSPGNWQDQLQPGLSYLLGRSGRSGP